MYKILILLVWKNLDERGALSPPHTVKMYVPYLHSKKDFNDIYIVKSDICLWFVHILNFN